MIQLHPLPPQQSTTTTCCRSLNPTWRIVKKGNVGNYMMIQLQLILMIVVVSMRSSVAFVVDVVVPKYHHHYRPLPYSMLWQSERMYRSSSNSGSNSCRPMAVIAPPEPQELQEPPPQQLVDEEYFNALRHFAAAAATTTTMATNDTSTIATTATSTNTVSSSSSVSSSSVPSSSSWKDDGFIFGLNDALQRPSGKQALLVVEGDSMETQPYQVALVSITLLNHLYYLLSSIMELYHTNNGNNIYSSLDMMTIGMTAIQIIVLSVLSWISADFGSGVLHWSVDNYGNGRTPIMGNIIAAFQGHHTAPWTITKRSFYNNVYKLCIPFGIIPVTAVAYLTGPMMTYFITSFCILEILSQEFHKWSHQIKSETPWIGNVLQKYHLSIGRVPHTKHHTLPFETNYCIISGICNPILEQYGFFRRLEHIIYQWNGIESNAWKLDPILRQRTMNGIYTPPEPVVPIK